MKLLYLSLSFLALFLLDFYLKSNISGVGAGSLNLPLLVLFVTLGGLLFLWRASMSLSILIRRSTFFLLCFIAYFVFRIGVDIGSIEQLKAYTFATTGGVVLFYTLGTIVSIILDQHRTYSLNTYNYSKYFTFFFLVYSTVTYFLLLNVLFDFGSRLRSDIFLVEGLNGAYQRPGDFLAINYLLLLALYGYFVSFKRLKPSTLNRFTSFIIFSLLSLHTITSLLISQMIGSNKTTVLIGGLGIILISIVILLWSKSTRTYLNTYQLNLRRLILGRLTSRLIAFFVVSMAILVSVIIVTASYLGIDLTMTRLGGFGSGELSSVTSRLALLENFAIHFSYSPIIGNMGVDCLTTGCGSYVHSFLASSLTHLGLVGFLLLAAYFVFAYKERFKQIGTPSNHTTFLMSNIVNLYSILFFTAVLFVAIVGTFITWAVIWFAMGLFFQAIIFKNKNE